MRCQRSIELDTAHAWRVRNVSSKGEGAAEKRRWMSRTDSAFEVHRHG